MSMLCGLVWRPANRGLQGFADGRLPLGSDDSLTVRVGRQVMKYGSGRLINEGPNVRLSFDGGLARWETDDWRVDGFYARPVKHHFDSFNDHADGLRNVWSLHATGLPQIGPDRASTYTSARQWLCGALIVVPSLLPVLGTGLTGGPSPSMSW
jgi:Alginate export